MALEDNGFKVISGAMSGPAIRSTSLKFVPFTTRLPGLQDAVDAVRQSTYQQPVIVVLFHLYDFEEVSLESGVTTPDEFTEWMNWLTSQEDVRVVSMNQVLNEIPDLSASRLIISKKGFTMYRLAEKAMSKAEKEQYKALYPERAVPLQWTTNAVGYNPAKFIPR